MQQLDMFAPPEDAELGAAIVVLAQPSIEWIINRHISGEAGVTLKMLTEMPAEISKAKLKAHGEQISELRRAGCIAVSFKETKAHVRLNRARIIALARDTNRRLDEWGAREAA